jgi:hypothetical protein
VISYITTIPLQPTATISSILNGAILVNFFNTFTSIQGRDIVVSEPLVFEIPSSALAPTSGGGELNVSGLQPDTEYTVQVSALTRRGEGEKSSPVVGATQGGVPNKPSLETR